MGIQLRAIECPTCGYRIALGDLDLAKELAICSACQGVVAIHREVQPSEPSPKAPEDSSSPTTRPRPRRVLAKPENAMVENTGSSLTIRARWFTPMSFFLMALCVLWDVCIFATLDAFILRAHDPWDPFLLFELLFLTIASLGINYFAICLFVNSTIIVVDRFRISVSFGPIYFPGKITHYLANVTQISCGPIIDLDRGGEIAFSGLYILTSDGKKIPLLGDWVGREHILFFEQEIERFLKIQDRPVPGDWV